MEVGDDTEPAPEPAPSTDAPMDVETDEVFEPQPASDPTPTPEPFTEVDADADADADADDEFSEAAIAKEALRSEISDGMSGTRPDKAVVGEILLALEAQNPTRSPATSPLLNGRWKFLYATGASPGLKALSTALRGVKAAPKSPSGADLVDVADTYLTISPSQPRAVAEVKVRLLSLETKVSLSSQLEAESAVRLVETYEDLQSDYMNLKLPFQGPVGFKRSVLLSYLDDEMMVVRDAMGRPDVLVRVVDGGAWGTTDVDTAKEDDAPGAS